MPGNSRRKYKLAVVASHPIQYQAPLWRKLAAHPEIDLTVYYGLDWGVSEKSHKRFFGVSYKWDVPLLEGYRFKFLRNYSPNPGPFLGGFINPGIIWELWKNRYDAVLVLGWMDVTFWFAFFAAWVKRTPIFLRTVASDYYDEHIKRPPLLLTLKHAYLRILFRKVVSGFLAIGTWNRNFYLQYGVPPERIFHFPYSVDNNFFFKESTKHASRRDSIRKELGIAPDAVVIAFAARFVKEKHPDHVILAYEKMKDVPCVALLMVGDGPMHAELERMVSEKKLKNVHFTGFQNQSEIVKLYSISDIFVRADAPHKGDWGATVNEALACGLPVVCTDAISSQADLIEPGKNGFTYALGDIDAFASHIKKLALDANLLGIMKQRALDRIFSWGYDQDVEGMVKALAFCSEHHSVS